MTTPVLKKTIQPTDIFKMLQIKNTDEAHKVFNTALDFMIYMKTGDKVVTKTATFNKIASDLIQLEVDVDTELVIDTLEAQHIIRFPG